ncbi:MAG: zf-TFIIB domain-containing protein [Desulfobacterales bacterium]
MNCPVCNVKLLINNRQGIEIDYCPDCRGIWLDRGELDKIIERSVSEIPQVQYRQSDYEHHDEHHGKHHGDKHYDGHYKKKKSFLFDLFD